MRTWSTNRPIRRPWIRPAILLVSLALAAGPLPGCATLGEIAALRLVEFELGRATDGRLAGIDLSGIRSYRDLSASDVLRLAQAARSGALPMNFTLHVDAKNPADNRSAARLLRLDWTLLLDDQRTVAGSLDREFRMEPGQSTDIPLAIQLDLLQFFRRDVKQLFDLALDVTGRQGNPVRVKLVAQPSVMTPLGPMRYPGEITIASKTYGRAEPRSGEVRPGSTDVAREARHDRFRDALPQG